MERGDRVGEQHQCRLGFTVGGVQARRVAREKALEELDPLLTHEGHALVPRCERPAHVGLRERHARDPERVGDPVGISERPRRNNGFLGVRESLVDQAGRLEAVDVRRDAVAPIAAVTLGNAAGELDVAIEVSAVHVAELFDERGVSRLARVVAVVELELGRPVCALAGDRRPAGEARVARGGAQAGKPAYIGRGRPLEQLLGPRQRLEQLHREPHERGMGRDVGRHLQVSARRAPLVSRPQVAQLGLDPVDCVAPAGAVPILPSRRRLTREVRSVPIARALARARLGQAVIGELADGLEEAVSGACDSVVSDHQRLPDE